MSAIDDLVKNLKRTAAQSRQAQIRFVECESVDWDARTMTASGASDDVQYLDIMLGLGGVYVKPVKGSVCLIGLIDGQEVAAFLIAASEVELVEVAADTIVANGGRNLGLVMAGELAGRLNAIEQDLNTIKTVFAGWAPVAGDGGAALKAAAGVWAARQLDMTTVGSIQNDKIKH